MAWREFVLAFLNNGKATILIVLLTIGGKIMAENKKSSDAKIATWLSSGEFQVAMDNALTNILKGAHNAKSEADTATLFENEIYFLLRQQLGFDAHFQKEVSIRSGVVHNFGDLSRRKSGKGRMDAVINSLVIEYKHREKLKNPI